jgi:hypothetical protein
MTALQVWITKLKSAHPAERAGAIRALEQLGDTDALPALAELFATDPEPALRAQAQQAGKVIYYGAIRRALEASGASEEQRRQAAEIIKKAQAKKIRRK